MKRWLITGAIFVGTMFLLVVLNVLIVFMPWKATEQATGIALVISPESLTVLFIVTVLVLAFAVWLSGKLVQKRL